MSKLAGDIDIDFPDRAKALSLLTHTGASILRDDDLIKHNTGVYFHNVPVDPITGLASINYEDANKLGWYKIDLLNVSLYEQIRDENHLIDLMNRDLDFTLFEHEDFTKQLIHLNNHFKLVAKLKPKSIEDLAIILALIRPGKKYLVDNCVRNGFKSIEKEIWTTTDEQFSFKKSHSISYAVLVKVHACLIIEQLSA